MLKRHTPTPTTLVVIFHYKGHHRSTTGIYYRHCHMSLFFYSCFKTGVKLVQVPVRLAGLKYIILELYVHWIAFEQRLFSLLLFKFLPEQLAWNMLLQGSMFIKLHLNNDYFSVAVNSCMLYISYCSYCHTDIVYVFYRFVIIYV